MVETKNQLVLGFEEDNVVLVIAVKIPGKDARVIPLTIENLDIFMEEEFDSIWAELKGKVRNELEKVT